ncbi:lysM domain receptor-like kinase 10 [Triticum aestivum]|uniref:lysM domain receptor-like kinase 10 n=1 Tax=Triticum aestivum TaxID=4565 RepID=UPI0008447121|nr:lysM domain receptor-like kinase 10 [Triticum aestivum]
MAPAGRLVVQVAGADLEDLYCRGTTMAFVVLSFDSQQFRTSVKYKKRMFSLEWEWDERFYFYPLSSSYNVHNLVLEASVYSTDESFPGQNSFHGKATINMSSFWPFNPSTRPSRYPLEKRFMLFPVVSGKLDLNVYYDPPDFDSDREDSIRGNWLLHGNYPAPVGMCVEVVSAQNLRPKDDRTSGWTCVEVSFDFFRLRTANCETDVNPVWNQRFYFDMWEPSNLHLLNIEAYVYRVDTSFKRSKTLLGKVTIAGKSCGPFSEAVLLFHPLEKPSMFSLVSGELCLKVYTIDLGSIPHDESSLPLPRDVLFQHFKGITNNLESISQDESSRPRDVSLQYLKEITNNFTDERILGHGGFGVVYKGVLQNGEIIAVKKIASSFMLGQKQFENEVYHLMMLKHPNIVRFIGYCYETRNECLEYEGKHVFAETPERLLCLEYLSKGSLDKYITDESSGLDWSTRYKIIEGVCYGLCYLHEQTDKPIIHLDLKPANILLDDDMVPKITDFGLSRPLDKQKTVCTSSRDGTFGYMAPEFLHEGKITPKSDIFSLGVIIMEIVIGDRNYPDTGTPSDDFMELVRKTFSPSKTRSLFYINGVAFYLLHTSILDVCLDSTSTDSW